MTSEPEDADEEEVFPIDENTRLVIGESLSGQTFYVVREKYIEGTWTEDEWLPGYSRTEDAARNKARALTQSKGSRP